jgi:hypothetical protein
MRILLALLACAALAAQDLTGRWTGVAMTTDEAGTKRQERQTIEFTTVDGKPSALIVSRTGTGGRQLQMQQEGPKVNLVYFLDFEGGEPLRWKLEMKDGKLTGTFSAMHDSPKKWIYDRVGSMTLEKVEPAK